MHSADEVRVGDKSRMWVAGELMIVIPISSTALGLACRMGLMGGSGAVNRLGAESVRVERLCGALGRRRRAISDCGGKARSRMIVMPCIRLVGGILLR